MSYSKKNSRLTYRIMLAMLFGVVFGISLRLLPSSEFVQNYIIDGVLNVCGQIFVLSLKMLVVPLVFFSLVCGTAGLDDIKELGKIGSKTMIWYLLTTAIAIGIALFFAGLTHIGKGLHLPVEAKFVAENVPTFSEVLIGIMPSNPIQSAAEGNMLQIIVFAILVGIAVSIGKKEVEIVHHFFEQCNTLVMRMITMLMGFAPFGVFTLISKVFAQQGLSAIVPLMSYFLLVVFVLLVHLFIVYSALLKVFAKINPKIFFKRVRSNLLFAFSTASSNATLPVTLSTVTEKLGVPKSIAAFTIPLGATVNMDGTAIMQGVATVFLANIYQIELHVLDYLMIITMATLASVGTAGVPGVGLITLAMVLKQVGIPIEGIGLIMGVDRLLDMLRTVVNVCGDVVVSCLVAKSEGTLTFDQIVDNDD